MSKVINIYKFDLPCRLQVYEMYFKTFFSFKMGQPRPLFVYFRSFSNKHYKFLQQIYVKKCPSSIRCRDLNPRPLEHESLPITTRPGLPPMDLKCYLMCWVHMKHVQFKNNGMLTFSILVCCQFWYGLLGRMRKSPAPWHFFDEYTFYIKTQKHCFLY